MSLETEFRRESNLTPTRFLLECEDMNSGFGLALDNPYSPFDATYKYLNPGIPRSDADLEVDLKTPSSTASMLSQSLLPTSQHPWSDMVLDEACMPMRQMSPRISTTPSNSSSSSASTPPLTFRSRTTSTSSDQIICHPEGLHAHTHEFNESFDKLAPTKQSYHSDLELSSLARDSTTHSLVPSDTLRQHNTTMNKYRENGFFDDLDLQNDMDYDDQDMSDQHDSAMDVDSDESNDEAEDGETGSSKGPFGSRESSSSSTSNGIKNPPRTRASARVATKAAKASSQSTKSSSSTSKAKKTRASTKNNINSMVSRKQKSTAPAKKASREISMPPKSSNSQSRKHSSPEEESLGAESPEAKRQKFLERNRMAASKCREKKRLQTLKTIADADAITARNQALHESLDELQEEVRTLKNQILCHRDCGCDVIQKFVRSSFGTAPYLTVGAAANQMHTQMQAQMQFQNQLPPSIRNHPQLC